MNRFVGPVYNPPSIELQNRKHQAESLTYNIHIKTVPETSGTVRCASGMGVD